MQPDCSLHHQSTELGLHSRLVLRLERQYLRESLARGEPLCPGRFLEMLPDGWRWLVSPGLLVIRLHLDWQCRGRRYAIKRLLDWLRNGARDGLPRRSRSLLAWHCRLCWEQYGDSCPALTCSPAHGCTSSRSVASCPTVGRYHLEGSLGAAQYGVTYRAWDPVFERRVALTVALPNISGSAQEASAKLLIQARRAGRLRHPAFPEPYELIPAGSVLVLVRRYFSGVDLRWVQRRKRRLRPQLAAAIICSLTEALGQMHRRGWVHGNLRPSCVVLGRKGAVGIVDLSSTVEVGREVILEAPDRGITYLPPELQGVAVARADPRWDVFACGALLWELCSGQSLKAPACPTSKMGTQQHSLLLAAIDGSPAPLKPILRSALSPDPNERYPTGAALAAALRQVF
jgi:hypothetical protein